jgi:hypothetical protein
MVKILGREISIGQKKDGKDGEQAKRYDYSETEVKPALEERGALKMVFDQAGLRDSASFELDSVELRIENLSNELRNIAPIDEHWKFNPENYKKLTSEQKAEAEVIHKKIEILFMYRSLLFRCAYIGARDNPQFQQKLAALHSILERKIDIPGYLPRLRVLINHIWSVSWRLLEGRTPPPIIIETPQTYPIKPSGGVDLAKLGEEHTEDVT